jgi:asparagine synthase (glutamine-hydrolysing)
MCGIGGIWQPGHRVEEGDLRALAAALAHRGPDDEGIHLEPGLGLVHRRLSILDLSAAGRQPMWNEDGTVAVVYNGQLYDFEATRRWLEGRGHRFRSHTDTEVIVHLYEEKGDDFLAGLDGMFAFALWDARRRRLLLARDRLGIKPLFYAESPGRLAFASELGALARVRWVSGEIDPEALVAYLYQSSVPGDTCIRAGGHKLPPGHLLVATAKGTHLERYWDLDVAPTLPAEPFDTAAAALAQRLQSAVRSHLVADVPVGTFLSGGLDSALVTAAARETTGGPIHSFSVRFPQRPDLDEGPAARETAALLGTVHHEVDLGAEAVSALPDVVAASDEPFAVSSALALHHLARFARAHVKVVLTGDGADEILGGYPWRHGPSLARAMAMAAVRSGRSARATSVPRARSMAARMARLLRRPDEHYAETVAAFTPEEMDALLVDDLRAVGRRAWAANPVRRRYREAPAGDEINRRLRADLHTTLVDEMLTKVDRMTMASGLEARVPFLDRALVEWAFRQPGRHKVRGGTGKLLLRRVAARRLPRAAARPKHGFNVPLGEWLRGPLRERLRDALSPTAVARRGLFRADAVELLLGAHLAGREDHSRKVFTLLALELWLDAHAAASRASGRSAQARVEPMPSPATFS